MTQQALPQRWVVEIRMTPPELKNNTADAERLAMALKAELSANYVDMDLPILKKLPDLIRSSGYHLKCLVFKNRDRWVLVDVRTHDDSSPFLGLAVDLGTTRVVLRVMNLESGDHLEDSSFDNPQISIGPDILTRIHYTDQADYRSI